MQVNSTLLLGAQLKAAESGATSALNGGSFMDALDAAKKKAAVTNGVPPGQTPQDPASKQVQSADNSAYQALLQWMKETPEQHLRDKIMKDMGLTDASLAAMTPEQRSAVEAAIAQKIKDYMLAHNQTPPQSADAAKATVLLPS